MAVLEISELPGKASIIDWAFFLGSSAGTLEAFRAEMICVVRAGRFRIGSVGRRRAVPAINQYGLTTVRRDWSSTYQSRTLLALKPCLLCCCQSRSSSSMSGTRSSSFLWRKQDLASNSERRSRKNLSPSSRRILRHLKLNVNVHMKDYWARESD